VKKRIWAIGSIVILGFFLGIIPQNIIL
jgi:hypothetical protein